MASWLRSNKKRILLHSLYIRPNSHSLHRHSTTKNQEELQILVWAKTKGSRMSYCLFSLTSKRNKSWNESGLWCLQCFLMFTIETGRTLIWYALTASFLNKKKNLPQTLTWIFHFLHPRWHRGSLLKTAASFRITSRWVSSRNLSSLLVELAPLIHYHYR